MTTISIKLQDRNLKYLRKMSHFLSLERNTDLTLSDLVREALENTYPMPKGETNEVEEEKT